ncbi:MAG TPA: alanine--tRNA ligase [Acidimicrobiales bacterium]|nr:alanine--tRNA ligase [Acidimicrobiales bacterium]
MTTSAADLRRAFTDFFVARAHTLVPSSGLIPHHPLAPLFTNAGMNQFLPYLLGEEPPPWPRATSVQKCVRIRGKHDDIEIIGRTSRHLTFFEMLGNFSFGDYFKESAIPWHWELLTEVLGIEADRLWVTVYLDDDETAEIWRDAVGVPPDRIQRLGEDNFWEMAETGPCGPSSEIFFDKGPEHGEDGGPLHGGEERFVEIANLVFLQYERQRGGALEPLPRRNIDTGSGLDRILPVMQGVDSVFDTDVLKPVVDAAARVTGRRYGDDEVADVALRILADHARSMTFLVSDGVFPSNEDRGYVLRRIIRRAVRHAFALGVEREVSPTLVEATVDVMGDAYPELVKNRDFVLGVVTREEAKFRQTLRSGSAILDEELTGVRAGNSSGGAAGADRPTLSGSVAFRLHDTFGFPLELTLEVAGEHGVEVDRAGFDEEMETQRRRARAAQAGGGAETDPARAASYRDLLEQFGPTEFTGYVESESQARVVAVLEQAGNIEIFLDRTPFYAESGGQLGDTGIVHTDTGTAQVVDTTYALPGLRRHLAVVTQGHITTGQVATASIDADRREAIRRNHTGTHILHWALREVLGEHVKQAGSLVAPDRLRFDFSHYGPVTPEELVAVEDAANAEVIANQPVRAYETTQEEALRLGAIAFFGEKYGDVVRVVEAGRRSVELCGGTHVGALGTIGPIKIVSEGSIGSNLRRIEAVTGTGSLQRIREEEQILGRAATLLRVAPPEVPERVEHVLGENRELADRLKALRRQQASDTARSLVGAATDGVIVARVDGTSRQDLQDLAVAVRDQPDVRAVVLGSVPEAGGVTLVAAVAKGSGLVASDLIADAARTVGGGGGKSPEIAVAGGRDPSRLDEALDQARRAASAASADDA